MYWDMRVQFPQGLYNLDYATIIRRSSAIVNRESKKACEDFGVKKCYATKICRFSWGNCIKLRKCCNIAQKDTKNIKSGKFAPKTPNMHRKWL